MSVRNILLKWRPALLRSLDDVNYVVEILYSKKCLSTRQYQSVKSERIQLDKLAKLLDCIMVGDVNAFWDFCEALSEEYDWIAQDLQKEATESGITRECSGEQFLPIISDEILQIIPTERQLMKISKILVKMDWEPMIFGLGLSYNYLEQTNQLHSQPVMKCMKALVEWLRTNGENATFSVLYKCLKDNDIEPVFLNEIVNSL